MRHHGIFWFTANCPDWRFSYLSFFFKTLRSPRRLMKFFYRHRSFFISFRFLFFILIFTLNIYNIIYIYIYALTTCRAFLSALIVPSVDFPINFYRNSIFNAITLKLSIVSEQQFVKKRVARLLAIINFFFLFSNSLINP